MEQLFFQPLPLGGVEAELSQVFVHLAADDDLLAGLDFVGQVGLVEPGHLDSTGSVGELGFEDFPAASGLLYVRFLHLGDNGHLFAIFEPIDGLELREIVVAAGQQVEHIADGENTQFGQSLGSLRAYTAQHDDRGIEAGPFRGRLSSRFFGALWALHSFFRLP